MKIRNPTIFILILAISLIIFFQNCGDIKVLSVKSAEKIEKISTQDRLCSPYGYYFGSPLRFIFIMDMSISNIGRLNTITTIEEGREKTSWFLDTSPDVFPTDLDGNRFDLAKEFIEDCSGGENVTYSVLGFGGSPILPLNETCLSEFKDKSEALDLIQGMRSIQTVDLTEHQSGVVNGSDSALPLIMQNQTKYSSAVSCLEQKITEDLYVLPADEKPIYYVFFLTDGAPTDSNTELSELISKIQTLSSQVSDRAGGLRFIPIMYTIDGAMTNTEKTKALSTLNSMAHVVSSEVDALELNNIGSDLSNVFCEQVQPQSKATYELTNVFAVNLSAKASKGILQSDSDQDGVSDDDERRYGWNPLDSHSTGVLDSLCLRYSTKKEDCQSLIDGLECSSTFTQVGLLINSCDRLFSTRIFGKSLDFMDTDFDEIPDLVEILRSTHPALNDALAMPFSDQISNLQKIKWGLDTQSSADISPLPESNKTLVRFSEDFESCSSESKSYSIFLDQLPIIPGMDYVDPIQNPIDLSRGAEENIYMLYSVWQTQGGATVQRKVQTKALRTRRDHVEPFGTSSMKIRGGLK